ARPLPIEAQPRVGPCGHTLEAREARTDRGSPSFMRRWETAAERIRRTRPGTHPAAAAAFAAILAIGAPMSGAAGSQPIPARIAWTARDRVYLASPDSLPLQVGDRITFRLRGDSVAAAEVTVVVAPEMAVARLTRGALLPHGDLQQVEILVEPPPLEPMYLLRVGLPGRARSNLIFACDPSLRPPAGYRVQGSSRRGLLLVRNSAAVAGPQRPWPDTLQVRLYDETADEEIAIERGDLDVAVFWPGELTARLRAPPRSLVTLGGGRSRGVVAAIRTDRGPARDSSAFVFPDRAAAALDGAVFRGDLERFPQAPPERRPAPGGAGSVHGGPILSGPARDRAGARPAGTAGQRPTGGVPHL